MDKKTITREIDDLKMLESLASAYAEISSSRMKNTRESVLSNRFFLSEIDEIFKELRLSYRRELLKLAKKRGLKKGNKITLLGHNGKTVALLISANTGLYGDLTRQIFESFMKEVERTDVEASIVGKLGRSLFIGRDPNRPYSYFEMPDNTIDREELANLIRHLVQYEEIHVYYGKFSSIIYQSPSTFNISAQTELVSAEETKESKDKDKLTKYFFEPTLEEILIFFEREMFTSVFEQAIHESQLAKFASRMIAMDQASERVRQTLKIVEIDHLKVTHNLANKKQTNVFPGIMSFRANYVWKKLMMA